MADLKDYLEYGVLGVLVILGSVCFFWYNKITQAHKESLQNRIAELEARISEQKLRHVDTALSTGSRVIPRVVDVIPDLRTLISGGEVTGDLVIRNLALDMETVSTFITYDLMDSPSITGVTYKGLVIDPESPAIAKLIDPPSNVTGDTVREVLSRLASRLRTHRASLVQRNISIEVRKYELPPVLHGFMVNHQVLYVSGTQVENSKLQGGQYPYLRIRYDRDSALVKHIFQVYEDWFEYHWSHGRLGFDSNRTDLP